MNGKEFELETVHWTMAYGNPFRRKITPVMLYGEEPHILSTSKLRGQGKYDESKGRVIVYDREYALAKVINDVLKPLGRLDDDVIDEFLAEAKRRFRDENTRC